MNRAQLQSEQSAGSVILALGGVLREFKDTAEAVLNGLRERPVLEAYTDGVGPGLEAEQQLRELRAAMPRRVLSLNEGLQVAERQAALLRWQLDRAGSPALPTGVLAGLPFLTVIYRASLAKSGLVMKTGRGWVIVLRSDEPRVRQRFSLAHEIKHALDDELVQRIPEGLYRTWDGRAAEDLAERVCDHFAGCLLMPKMLLRADWTRSIQNPSVLARRYYVSRAAMDVRLRQLGLIEPTPRCGTTAARELDFDAAQSNDRDEQTSARNEAA